MTKKGLSKVVEIQNAFRYNGEVVIGYIVECSECKFRNKICSNRHEIKSILRDVKVNCTAVFVCKCCETNIMGEFTEAKLLAALGEIDSFVELEPLIARKERKDK